MPRERSFSLLSTDVKPDLRCRSATQRGGGAGAGTGRQTQAGAAARGT